MAIALLAGGVLLGAARLFTGVVYGSDSPVAYFILKSAPNLQVERPETPAHPIEREIVLDSEEPQLIYGSAYIGLMQAVPILMVLVVGLASLLLWRRGSPRS